MIRPECARCGLPLPLGALVVEVRQVTRADESLSHDRTDLLAHLQCPPATVKGHAGFTQGSVHPGPAAECSVEFCRRLAPDIS